MSISKPTLLLASGALLVAVQSASAQQMGRNGYSFPARNPSLAAQFQFQRLNGGAAGGSSAAGLGALNQYVTTDSSNSTSIGNMNTVTQILSDGSTGSVGQTTDQQSTGNQGSEADTNTTVDNSIESSNTTTASSDQATDQSSGSETTTENEETTQSAN